MRSYIFVVIWLLSTSCLSIAFRQTVAPRSSLALQANLFSRIQRRIQRRIKRFLKRNDDKPVKEEDIDIDLTFDDEFFAKMKNDRRELKAESLFDKLASESPDSTAGVSEQEESLFKELQDDDGKESTFTLSNQSDNSIENLLKEKEELEYEYQRIRALEQRNEAQLGSFVDQEAQWESLTVEEQNLLNSKESVISCIDSVTEVLRLLQQ